MKKLICILLTLSLLLAMIPGVTATEIVAHELDGGNLYFDKNGGIVVDCDETVIHANIPSEIEGITVNSIADGAFSQCTCLVTVHIPQSLTYIGEYAFEGCIAITDVYYGGTSEQWSRIDFTKGNHLLTDALIHFANGSSFADVDESAYYADAVLWAVRNGITNGIAVNEFAPEMICTRGQIVTFLYRAFGSPEPESAEHPFDDLSIHAYYYKAVLWAVENGITSGISENEFAPEAFCTRGQAVTFLYRACQMQKQRGAQNNFSDVHEDDYFFDAVNWASEHAITNGVSQTAFAPEQNCTRAQIVTFLLRAMS